MSAAREVVGQLAAGLAIVILVPASGFWLVILQAVIMLVAARRGRGRPETPPASAEAQPRYGKLSS